MIASAQGDPLPGELLEQLQSAGVDAHEFSGLIEHVTEIVYSSLYGATDLQGTLEHLESVLEVADRAGVVIPAPDLVSDVRISDDDGWGRKLSRAELAALRSLGTA